MKSVQITALMPPRRRVDGGQNDNGNRCADVDEKRFSLTGLHAANHFIRKRKRDRRYIQARTGRQHARNHENSGCRVFRRHAKARGEIFVDRINFVVVVRLDENVADQNARQNRAERQLQVGVVAQCEAFPGRTEKSAGACFRRDDRSEHGPPRNCATAEREIFEVLLLPAHVKADGNDDDEIEKQNRAIDREPSCPCRRSFSHGLTRIHTDKKISCFISC